MKQHLNWLVLMVPLGGLLGALLIASKFREESAFEILSSKGILDSNASELCESFLPVMVKGTRFEGKVTVNRPARLGSLNVYFARLSGATAKGLRWLEPVRGNCAFVGHHDTHCSRYALCAEGFLWNMSG